MQTAQKETVSVLNDLLEICRDGEKGFDSAAAALKESALKADCRRYSQQRAQFASELDTEIRRLEGTPTQSGSAAAALHRGWLDLRAAISKNTDEAIIKECERGEDVAKEAYEKALKEDLSADTAQLVRRQYSSVKQVHDRFSALQKAIR